MSLLLAREVKEEVALKARRGVAAGIKSEITDKTRK